ncbi:MAG: type II secretion system F family protein [Anaerolineales bacterium]|nr:type II secretion system F family protein [Anaerolineales bacterium]
MDISTIALFASFSFVLLGITFIAYASSFIDAHQISQRLYAFILEDQMEKQARELSVQNLNFSESFVRRTVGPILTGILTFLGRFTPARSIEKVNRDLSLAGVSFMRAQQYYGLRLILMIFGLGFGFYVFSRNPVMDSLLAGAAVVGIVFILPILWLRLRVARKKDAVLKSLPDALDMLAVSTAAGLGFDQSMMKVSQFYKSAAADEFARVVSEIEVGISRQEALRNFSHRVEISEVSSFVAVIIQSEILGMSIADVLASQAEQMRIQRQYRAKEIAQRLPVKMMVPLALLIFPALLAVLLGPTIPAFLEIF